MARHEYKCEILQLLTYLQPAVTMFAYNPTHMSLANTFPFYIHQCSTSVLRWQTGGGIPAARRPPSTTSRLQHGPGHLPQPRYLLAVPHHPAGLPLHVHRLHPHTAQVCLRHPAGDRGQEVTGQVPALWVRPAERTGHCYYSYLDFCWIYHRLSSHRVNPGRGSVICYDGSFSNHSVPLLTVLNKILYIVHCLPFQDCLCLHILRAPSALL